MAADDVVRPDDVDEDAFVVPASWWPRVHPLRGLDPVPPTVPDPDAVARAAALLDELADQVQAAFDHPDTDAELADRARRHLGTGSGSPGPRVAEDDPLGAAVVARALSQGGWKERHSELAGLADDWFLRRGPAWAAEAGVRLGEVVGTAFDGTQHRFTALARVEPAARTLQLGTVWGLLARLRRLLASVDDAAHAEVLARLAPLRDEAPGLRVVAGYLAPGEHDGFDRDVRAYHGGLHGSGLCYLLTTTDASQAAHLLARIPSYEVFDEPDVITTVAVHVGPAVAPALAGLLDAAPKADRRTQVVKVLAQLPGDDAFAALLARADQKQVSPGLLDAQRRFPRRAGRLLAEAATGASGAKARASALDALCTHLASHPGLAQRLRPELDPTAAAVVDDLDRAEAAVVPAGAGRVPALLADPPWTTRPKAAKAVVLDLGVSPEPSSLAWAPGEREAWAAIDVGHRWLLGRGQSWSELLVALLAGQQRHGQVTILAMAPPEEAAAALAEVTPPNLFDAGPSLQRLLANVGEPAVGWVLERVRAKPTQLAEVLLPVEGAEVAASMADWLRRSKSVRPAARAWFDRHPEAAARDLLAPALGKRGTARTAAEAALRHLAGQGHADAIRARAAGHGAEAAAAIDAVLATDPLHLLPARIPTLPAWLEPAALPPLLLADRSAALPADAVGALLTMVALSKPGEPYAGIEAVRPELDPASLAEVGWAAFERWRSAGLPAKGAWLLDGLALVGDDETVRRLAPVIRAWPGEGAHARAVAGLDVLAAIGTDVALLHLNGIAEKVRFQGLKTKAGERIAEVAEGLGLSAEQLADRLVPDLGLDADGSMVLDYGPRRFRVGFDEHLKPVVFDADGARRKTLPKPGAEDDAATAEPAYARFTALKKDARAIAADQVRRFEQAMVAQRRWPATELRLLFVDHPLVGHLSRRLVWATFDERGTVTGSFRVAEDRSLAEVEDREVKLAEDAIVGVAHPLHLGEAVGSWADVFADYELLQPFAQLDREVLALTEAERSAPVLDRLDGVTVATGTILGLTQRGWERGVPLDAGVIGSVHRELPGNRFLVLDLDPGILVGGAFEHPEQVLSHVWLREGSPDGGRSSQGRPFGELDPISASELLRDLDHLRS